MPAVCAVPGLVADHSHMPGCAGERTGTVAPASDGGVARQRGAGHTARTVLRPRLAPGHHAVRVAYISLCLLARRDGRALRRSVVGLAGSTAIGAGLLVTASFTHGAPQIGLWALALALDMAGPYFFGAEGWKLVPGHFAERH